MVNETKKILSIIAGAISGFGGFILLLLNWYVSVYPDKVREMVGDKFMGWLLNLPLSIIAIILMFVFILFLIYSMLINGVYSKKSEVAQLQPILEKNKQAVKDSGIGLQNPIFNAPVSFGQTEVKREENLKTKDEREKIVFHRMHYYKELLLEGSSPEQVTNYIREDIASSLWYIHTNDNNVAYDIDYTRTKFYNPSIDNTDSHGIVFYGLKYELEKGKGGALNRKNMVSVPNIFTISVASAGFSDKTKLNIKFNTQTEEVVEFFDVMKKALRDSKIFNIKENGVAGAWR